MANSDVFFKGITRSRADGYNTDGELSECVNMIVDNEGLSPLVLPTPFTGELEPGLRFMCTHRVGDTINFIFVDYNESCTDFDVYIYRKSEGQLVYLDKMILDADRPDNCIASVMGNFLVLTHTEGMYYLLWQDNAYLDLGKELPSVDIRFSAEQQSSDSRNGLLDFKYATRDQLSDDEETSVWACINKLISLRNSVDEYNEAVTDTENWPRDTVYQPGFYFTLPRFIRYGIRLFDGSYIGLSAPVLLYPKKEPLRLTFSSSTTVSDWSKDNPTFSTFSVVSFPYKITQTVLSDKLDLSLWEKLILSVDVFISPDIYPFDISKTFKNTQGFVVIESKDDGQDSRRGATLTIQIPPNISFKDNLEQCSTFYKIKSYTIEEFNNLKDNEDLLLEKLSLGESISTLESLPDTYHNGYVYIPKSVMSYNSRANLIIEKERIFNGYKPYMFSSTVTEGGTTTIVVDIKKPDGEVVSVSTSCDGSYKLPKYFFFPDSNAVAARYYCNGKYEEMKLEPHKLLNGAFYLNENYEETELTKAGVPPALNTAQYIPYNNLIAQSATDNPFCYPAKNVYQLSCGNIMGITTSARALSQGQFGQFPLYAFTDTGIWAMEVASTGEFSSKQIVARDVCSNADSITQIDGAVVFVTDKGLMVISGAEVMCLSEQMTGKNFKSDVLEGLSLNAPNQELLYLEDEEYFNDYLKTAVIAYDYADSRLVICNPDMTYQYIYSFATKTFSKMFLGAKIYRTTGGFPDSYMQSKDDIFNLSDIRDVNSVSHIHYPGFAITRPLTFSEPSVLKQIVRLKMRGLIDKNNGSYAKCRLYGSRDGVRWTRIRSLRGTGYKMFRFVIYANLCPTENVQGVSFEVQGKFTNRMR